MGTAPLFPNFPSHHWGILMISILTNLLFTKPSLLAHLLPRDSGLSFGERRNHRLLRGGRGGGGGRRRSFAQSHLPHFRTGEHIENFQNERVRESLPPDLLEPVVLCRPAVRSVAVRVALCRIDGFRRKGFDLKERLPPEELPGERLKSGLPCIHIVSKEISLRKADPETPFLTDKTLCRFNLRAESGILPLHKVLEIIPSPFRCGGVSGPVFCATFG